MSKEIRINMTITKNNLLVDKKTLAEIFKVDERSLTNWQAEGMPIRVKATRGKTNQYFLPEVFEWVINKRTLSASTANVDGTNDPNNPLSAELMKEKIRIAKADADTKELKYSRARQELIPTEKVVQVWSSILADIKNNVMVLGIRIPKLILGLTDRIDIEQRITNEVKLTLRSLAKPPVYEDKLEDILEDEEQEEQD